MSPFLQEFLGAFLGFGFALILNCLANRSSKRNTKVKLLNNLIHELNDIRTHIKKYIDNSESLYAPIYTPTWDALQNSGLSLELIDISPFSELIGTYSSIFYENEKYKNDGCISVDGLKDILVSCDDTLRNISCERKSIWVHQGSPTLKLPDQQ